MVQTRAAARRQQLQEAHLAQSNQPASLAAHETIVQINPSATGKGIHMRWIRPEAQGAKVPQAQDAANVNQNDQPLLTPIRKPNGIPHSPPKLLRRDFANMNQRPQWPQEEHNTATRSNKPQGKNLIERFQHLDGPFQDSQSSGIQTLASPFQDGPTSTVSTVPDQPFEQDCTYDPHMWNNTFQHLAQKRVAAQPPQPSNPSSRSDEVNALLKQYKGGLGPHGTIIVDQNGDPIVPSLMNRRY